MGSQKDKEKKVRIVIAIFAIFIMLYLVGLVLWNYIIPVFLAFFGYYFLMPLYKFLMKWRLGKIASGLITIFVGMIVVGIPIVLTLNVLVSEVVHVLSPENTAQYTKMVADNVAVLQNVFPDFDIKSSLTKQITNSFAQILAFFENLVLGSVASAGDFVLQLLVFIFVFYYLMTEEDKLLSASKKIFPFNKENTKKLEHEFNKITYSVLVCTLLIGLIQSVPLTLVFLYFNVPGAVILGFIAFLLTFIPFVGIPFVWIPVAIMEYFSGNVEAAIGITILGFVLTVLENIRPWMQRKVGDVHPIISVLGVIVGITYFGIMGLLIGPLLLSYTYQTAKMFVEEYV
ncbi:MAG: AI-2E family transporter [Candidatus Micrarchaeia archaeon]